MVMSDLGQPRPASARTALFTPTPAGPETRQERRHRVSNPPPVGLSARIEVEHRGISELGGRRSPTPALRPGLACTGVLTYR